MAQIHATVCTNGTPEEAAATLSELAAQARDVPGASVRVVTSGLGGAGHREHESAAAALGADALAAPLGLSAARNAALAAANEDDAVAFCDADVIPRPGWLAALDAHWRAGGPEVGAIGGPILPRFQTDPPGWMSPRVWMAYSLLDRGPGTRELRVHGGEDLWGANVSFRAGAALEAGGFDEWRGAWGPYPLFGEETALERRLADRGLSVIWASDVAVEHVIGAERLRLRELARRQFYRGFSAYLEGRASSRRSAGLALRAAAGAGIAGASGDRALAAERLGRVGERAGAALGPIIRRRLRRRGWPGP